MRVSFTELPVPNHTQLVSGADALRSTVARMGVGGSCDGEEDDEEDGCECDSKEECWNTAVSYCSIASPA